MDLNPCYLSACGLSVGTCLGAHWLDDIYSQQGEKSHVQAKFI